VKIKDNKLEWSSVCSASCARKLLTSDELKVRASKRNNSIVNEKRKETMLLKYGVEHNNQRPEVLTKIKKQIYTINKEWLHEEYITKQRNSVDIASELGCDYSVVLERCREYGFPIRQRSNYSLGEVQLQKFLEAHDVVVDPGNRTILDGKEIDLFLPEYNIGIEYHGLYWHRESKSHICKTELAETKGIRLIHIFEDLWNDKRLLVEKKILHILGKCVDRRIYARECTIDAVSAKESTAFAEANHIQGPKGGTSRFGLYYKGELVALLILNKNKIERFCTSCTVLGGFSKLFSYAQNSLPYNEYTTFADAGWSAADNVYLKNGFELLGKTAPNYWWVLNDKRESRIKYQKHKLNCLPTYSPDKTETQIMLDYGAYRVWDVGHYKYQFMK
jgi:hypothetical protein